MSLQDIFLRHILVPVFIVYLCVTIFDSSLENSFLMRLKDGLFWDYIPGHIPVKNFYSSVSCRGSNHTDRLCNFKNLCYEPAIGSFVFFHSFKSMIYGVPRDRFSPSLIDFSSAYDHNTLYFNYIDLPITALAKFNVSYIRGHALIFKRFNPENLMHVFHDDLIPAFVTLNELSLLENGIFDQNVFFAFADERPPGPYSDLYEDFLKQKPLYLKTLSTEHLYCIENAHIGLNKHSLWYQYGFKTPQGPLDKNLGEVSPALLSFREYFIKQFSLTYTEKREYAILLTRKHNRKILNEMEVLKEIEKKTNLITQTISLENYSIIDIITKIMKSQIIIGMHGSLIILSLFLLPHSVVIEFFPYGVNPNICTPYKTLAKIKSLKLIYKSWENKLLKNTVPHPEYPAEYGGIQHFCKEKQEQVENSKVSPFLCCKDPVWLYRIYQDTIIDTTSFSSVLSDAYSELQSLKINDSQEKREMGENLLYPGEVQNITCTFSYEDNILNISWDKPWNINFMKFNILEYELWHQSVDTNDVKAYIMKKSFFHFVPNSPDEVFYIWIRTYIDGRVGPFSSNPLACFE